MKYRADIDGLRAIAVISVVLFHARSSLVPGGFAGVDVFFVISGYLITSLLAPDFRARRFSLLAFYNRRARRILPALFAILLGSSIAAWWLLLPQDLLHYGASLIAVLSFWSNILFARSTDYFAPAAALTPLLHMWSLSVEEQFYIVYPLVLGLTVHHAPKHFGYLLLGLLLASFAYDLRGLIAPGETFYSTTARVWELLLGGVVASGILPVAGLRTAAIGLFLILFALFVPLPASISYVFPATVACFGAASVIHGGTGHRHIITRLLGSRPLVHVGLVSYSFYLWHWPVLVFARIYLLRPLAPGESALAIVGSFILAEASWRYLESPLRRLGRSTPHRNVFSMAVSAAAATALFANFIHNTHGAPHRFTGDELVAISGAHDSWQRWDECKYQACQVGASGVPASFILWGDSHAGSIAPALQAAADKRGAAGYIAFNPSCPPVIGLNNFDSPGSTCPVLARKVMNLIYSSGIHTVIIHASWASYAPSGDAIATAVPLVSTVGTEKRLAIFKRQMDVTLRELHDLGIRSVIITSVPRPHTDVPAALARGPTNSNLMPTIDEVSRQQAEASAIITSIAARYGAEILDPAPILCPGGACLAELDNAPLYIDDQHLSVHGAMMLAPAFELILAGK